MTSKSSWLKPLRDAYKQVEARANTLARSLSPVYGGSGGWRTIIQDPYPGAWQQNKEIKAGDASRHFAVYACVTLIANDIGKLPFLTKRHVNDYWQTQRKSPYSWLNIRPNHFQTPSKFRESWMFSKLFFGNAYILKQRDARGNVEALYVLDPTRVTPLVSERGQIFYRLSLDNLAGLGDELTVPASEVIHDRMNCLYHPLVGIPPLHAASAPVLVGLEGQDSMLNFFRNASNPGGLLMVPGSVAEETAKEIKEHFNSNFSGVKSGQIAVIADGVKFERLTMSSQDTQLIEHLKWSAENICSVFHVPSELVLSGAQVSNVAALRERYYGQCLQTHINSMHECLDEGLDVGEDWAIELDLAELLRTDESTHVTMLSNAVKGSIMAVNEARFRMDLPPVEGGDTIWMQQQNHGIQALAERDKNSPLLVKPDEVAPQIEPPKEEDDEELTDEEAREIADLVKKSLESMREG